MEPFLLWPQNTAQVSAERYVEPKQLYVHLELCATTNLDNDSPVSIFTVQCLREAANISLMNVQ